MDPLAALPSELVLKVLGHLSFKEITSSQRTSKSWQNLILTEPTLWHHFDLSGTRNIPRTGRRIPPSITDTAITLAASSITTITLFGDRMTDYDEAFARLAHHCPLTKVNLMETSIIHEDRLLGHTLRDVRGLRELRLGATSLHEVKLRDYFIEPHRETLEVLDLEGFQIQSDHCLARAVFPRIHTLRIAAKSQQGSGRVGPVADLHRRFPMLHDFEQSFVDPRRVPRERWPWDFTACAHLRRLTLKLKELAVQALVLPSKLTHLCLQAWPGQSDRDYFVSSISVETRPNRLYLPRLEALSICLPEMAINDVENFLLDAHDHSATSESLSNLTHLQVGHANALHLADGPFKHPRLQQLQTLILDGASGLEIAGMQSITAHLKDLRKLDPKGSDITDDGVRHIVQNS